MATKEIKKQVRGLIEGLEFRVHAGPPIRTAEIHSAREFLRQHDFSPASEYFNRLVQVQDRLETRPKEPNFCPGKRNYGGEAAGYWMQVQSAYDHVIFSTCYDGEFNSKSGRVKISHRFNQEGRIDFVELKYLRALHSCLNGEIRKLLLVKGYPSLRRDWHGAEAYVLSVLPRELIFLYKDIFRCPKNDVCAWLINIGHRLVDDLLRDLAERPVNGWTDNPRKESDQLCLTAVRSDSVAHPILEKAAALEAAVNIDDGDLAEVRYLHK